MAIISNIMTFVVLFGIWSYTWYVLREAKVKGKAPRIRRIPALDAIEEAVGRAAELGRPVLTSPSDGATLTGSLAPDTQAAFSVISYVVKLCARTGVKPIITIGSGGSEVVPLLTELSRDAYASEGKIEDFDDRYTVRYISGGQLTFSAGTMGIVNREKVASSILVGPWKTGAHPISMALTDVGALRIGGSTQLSDLPMFMAFTDFIVIGEEVFAAGAYLSGDKAQIATIVGEDVVKYISMIVMVLGALAMSLGFNIIPYLNM